MDMLLIRLVRKIAAYQRKDRRNCRQRHEPSASVGMRALSVPAPVDRPPAPPMGSSTCSPHERSARGMRPGLDRKQRPPLWAAANQGREPGFQVVRRASWPRAMLASSPWRSIGHVGGRQAVGALAMGVAFAACRTARQLVFHSASKDDQRIPTEDPIFRPHGLTIRSFGS